MLFIAVNWRIR